MKKIIFTVLCLLAVFCISACDNVSENTADTEQTDQKDQATESESESESADESDQAVVEKCKTHSYGEWSEVKAATCGANGSEQRVCGVCGHTAKRTLAAAGEHTYMDTGRCKICSKAMSRYFLFTLNDDAKSYTFNYDGNEKSVSVPSTYNELPVTKHSDYAFEFCSELTSVTLPDSITTFGNYAFASCQQLKSVNVPKELSVIGKNAFNGCVSLTSFAIPDAVTRIEYSAFANTGLTSVKLHDGITYIGDEAFVGCTDIKSVTIPASVEELGKQAFSACRSLKTVIIEEGTKLKVISESAFSANYLTRIVIPEGVTRIEKGAFSSTNFLTSISLPSTLEYIGAEAFRGAGGGSGSGKVSITYNGSEAEWSEIELGNKWDKGIIEYNITYAG